MTNVESTSSMVFFHDRPGAFEEAAPSTNLSSESVDYLKARERAERSAAQSARCDKAQQVHQALADCYAMRIRQSGQS